MKSLLVALAIVLALIVGGIGGYLYGTRPTQTVSAQPPPPIATPAMHEVVYLVPTSQCTNIAATYNVAGGTTSANMRPCTGQDEIYRYQAPSGQALIFSVTNTSSAGNRNHFSCEIQIDGLILSKIDAVGAGASATCNAAVP